MKLVASKLDFGCQLLRFAKPRLSILRGLKWGFVLTCSNNEFDEFLEILEM